MDHVVMELAKIATDLDADGFTKEADSIDAMIEKWAANGAMAYYQKNTDGKIRGIVRYSDERGIVSYYPETPAVGRTLKDVRGALQGFSGSFEENGMESPWLITSVFPFDNAGNKVA